MARQIDYDKIKYNINEMIDALEYDSQRSGGKVKVNASDLYYLYQMKERYAKINKPTPKKEG